MKLFSEKSDRNDATLRMPWAVNEHDALFDPLESKSDASGSC